MEWFKKINLEEYLNIIKYEKITGKDILEGDKSFYYNIMGTISDHFQKIQYEISRIKEGGLTNQKLYGWGNNTFGQLTIDNNDGFIRKPTYININIYSHDTSSKCELKNERDYFTKIYCGNTCSFLQTNHGEIYFAGNIFPIKALNSNNKLTTELDSNIEKESNSKSNKRNNKQTKNRKEPEKQRGRINSNISNSDKQAMKALNKWVNVSYLISYDKKTTEFFRAKQIYLKGRNEILVIGYQSTFVPYVRSDKKAKYKIDNSNTNVTHNINLNSIGSVKKSLTEKFCTIQDLLEKIHRKKLGDELGYTIVYENPMYGILECLMTEFADSEIPYHKVLLLKFHGEVIWDRKLRYIKSDYL